MQLCNRCRSFHLAPLIGIGNAIQGKREGLAHKVDAATIEAGRFGLTTATWYFEWHAWKLTRPKPTRLKVCQGTTRPASQTNRPSRLYRPIHKLGAALVSVTIPCAANLGCARFPAAYRQPALTERKRRQSTLHQSGLLRDAHPELQCAVWPDSSPDRICSADLLSPLLVPRLLLSPLTARPLDREHDRALAHAVL